MTYIIDTHALIWYLEDSSELGHIARSALAASDSRLVVPAIALAEAQVLAFRKRITLPWTDIMNALETDERFAIYPLGIAVLRKLPEALNLEMHDAIICATALTIRDLTGEEVRLITRDRQIIASGLVETVW